MKSHKDDNYGTFMTFLNYSSNWNVEPATLSISAHSVSARASSSAERKLNWGIGFTDETPQKKNKKYEQMNNFKISSKIKVLE